MLTCRAAGAPTPDIKWFKDGTAIHSKSRFEIVQSGTLKIDGELRLQFSFIYERAKRGRQPEAAVTVLAHHGTRNPNYFEIFSPSWETSSIVEGRLHDLSFFTIPASLLRFPGNSLRIAHTKMARNCEFD